MMGHRFNPEHAKKLDNEKRRKMLPPNEIIQYLQLESNDSVVDLGAGTGYFTIPIAKSVAKVIAVDISNKMLNILKENLLEESITNVELIEHRIEKIPLHDNAVHKIIASLVMHEVNDLEQTLEEMKRILKPSGKVLIIEWEKKETESGPPMEERLLSAEFKRILEKYFANIDLVVPNNDQYILIGEKKD